MMSKRNLLCQVFSFILLAIPLAYGSEQVNSEAAPSPLADSHEELAQQDANSDENLSVKEEMEDAMSANGKGKGKKKKQK